MHVKSKNVIANASNRLNVEETSTCWVLVWNILGWHINSIHFNLHCTLLVVYVNITVVEGNI